MPPVLPKTCIRGDILPERTQKGSGSNVGGLPLLEAEPDLLPQPFQEFDVPHRLLPRDAGRAAVKEAGGEVIRLEAVEVAAGVNVVHLARRGPRRVLPAGFSR